MTFLILTASLSAARASGCWAKTWLETFPGGGDGGGGGVEQKWKYSSAQLGPELGNNFDLILFSDLMLI